MKIKSKYNIYIRAILFLILSSLFGVIIYGLNNSKYNINYNLTGEIEDNCVTYESINSRISDLYETLKLLKSFDFFNIFRVNISKKCENNNISTIYEQSCQKSCSSTWVNDNLMNKYKNQNFENSLSKIEIEDESSFGFEKETQEDVYVDILENNEGYTGYKGRNIWAEIYKHNCFSKEFNAMCKEEQLIYKVISGFHTSVTSHLSYYYNIKKRKPNKKVDISSLSLYIARINNPEYIKNLYFSNLVLLKTLYNLKDLLLAHKYSENTEVNNQIYTIFNRVYMIFDDEVCEKLINEYNYFNNNNKQKLLLDLKKLFKDIFKVLDCVECTKCKIWGKIQSTGLGVSLRNLFYDNKSVLSNNEITAFINTLIKWNKSILIYLKMSQKERFIYKTIYVVVIVLYIASFMLINKIVK